MRYSIGLLAVFVAACTGQAGNNVAGNGAGNAATGANMATPPPANTASPGNGTNTAGPAASAQYQASGTEPFWSLAIAGGQMVYTPADGTGQTVPAPPSTPIANGFEFATPTLTARFTSVPCSEASGNTAPYTVQVVVGGQTLNGCGT